MPNSAVYLTTQHGYRHNYDSLKGTSLATPHAAGLAGLVWARGACSSASCVRTGVESPADAISGTDTYWKWGRVNYRKAVNYVPKG